MHAAAAGVLYAIVTALLFRDLLPDLTTHLYSDIGDPLLNATVLEWSARHLPLTDEWWNFPSFAPLSGVTAFTEHLLATYPVAAPVIWLTGNAVLAYNVVLLLAFPLNGLAAYFLARELTGRAAAAFVGGLAFAFAPYMSVHLSHLQTLIAFGMPMALLGVHRYFGPAKAGPYDPGPAKAGPHDYGPAKAGPHDSDARTQTNVGAGFSRPGALLLFGIGWLITALSNAYMLVFFPLLIAFWCVWFVRPREWRRLVPPLVTALVFTLPLLPLLAGYQERQTAYGFTRSITEVRAFSADVVGLAGVSHREWLWRGILPHTYEESSLFPGLTILALALVAVGISRARRDAARQRDRIALVSRRLFVVWGVLMLVAIARALTGPFGWHIGPLPLPQFAPFRVVTTASVILVAAIVMTKRFREGWSRRDPVIFYATAVVLLWLFALGPQPEWSGSWRALAYGPYWLFIQLPGVSSVRVPARAWLPAAVCLSVLAAFGTAALLNRLRGMRAHSRVSRHCMVLAMITAGILAEGWFFDRHVPAPAPMPPGVIPAGAVVLDLPMEEGFWNALPQYRAVLGGYRTVNGYSGYEPPHFLPMRRAIADLRVDALNPYRVLADLYVIVRSNTAEHVAQWVREHPGAERVHAGPDADVFRLPRLHPDAPRRSLPLPLPRPGARPFGLD